ncbi:protein prune homolog 2-like isoform X1 [Portunus trituberculatus]|uniref:protein prune homolog 2-like isoform X1 n=2 Tax=Portunus trituberculatus TaxID=210409 RepID=UPI001E1D0D2E|nr:protein prune homolog 2-like isoform X1 [Portunus trituberculatus]
MNEISAGEGVPDPASEESMDVSEASNSSGTLANHSPLSDNIYSYEQGVRDPLRFPMQQNGRLVGAALERDLSSASGAGQAAAAPAGGQKPAPFNLSHLEYTLPDTEIYEPETVDFPNSPTALRYMVDPSEECGGVRLAEREDTSQPPATPTEEDRSLYTAVVSPPTGQVTLRKERPSSLEVNRKKRLTVTEELLTVAVDDDQHSISSLSQHSDDEDDDAQMLSHDEFTDMLTPDDIDTPDELEESIMERLGPQPRIDPLPEYTTSQEASEERSWRSVVISGIERRIDMKVIEPYKKVLSHGGYLLGSSEAIIVFSACFLPDRSRKDYDYVMDNLFMYVLTTLDQLIAEDYILIYLHGATTRGNMPSFAWLKRCYQMIDRRLRKNLQGLYLVHPTFWVKTVVVMTRPFVSAKFTRKLRFVNSLKELSSLIPMDQVCIPDRVKQYDEIRESLLVKA